MKKWSSQWTQFMQLRKEAWKKFRTSTGFEPVTLRYRCNALPTELWSHHWSPEFFFQGSFIRNSINCVHCDDHFFIFISFSAVHIWFISYIINTHLFHGNIWTHNNYWPAPNVSGFIAHHTGIARSRVQFKPRWSPEFFFRLLYAIA